MLAKNDAIKMGGDGSQRHNAFDSARINRERNTLQIGNFTPEYTRMIFTAYQLPINKQ